MKIPQFGLSVDTPTLRQLGPDEITALLYAARSDVVDVRKDYGAVGDGVTDDTAALQAAITDVETTILAQANGITLVQSAIYLPAAASFYKTTAPLNVSLKGVRIMGANEGVTIKNVTTDSDVLRVNFGGTGAVEHFCLENIRIIGTGTASRAIYLNCCERPRIVRVDCTGHLGSSLYMESTNVVFPGCVFAHIQDFRAQALNPTGSAKAIYDKAGLSPLYINVTAREAEIGIYLENVRNAYFVGGRFENNGQGTAKTAIQAVTTDGGDTTVPWHRTLTISGAYFEANTWAVDADAGYRVNVIGGFGSGGATAGKVALDAFRFRGGGSIKGFCSQGGVLVTSPKGKVAVADCDGIYGLARELAVEGAILPVSAKACVNSATNSWFDTDVAWGPGGTNPPTVTFDTAVGFYGKNSKKVAWATGGSGFGFSRTIVSNAVLTGASGDVFSSMLALKSDVAGELLVARNVQAAAMVQLTMVTDVDWHIVMLSSVLNASGNVFTDLHLGATPAGATNTWVGAVAAALAGNVGFLNTEAPALSFGGVQLQRVSGTRYSGTGVPHVAGDYVLSGGWGNTATVSALAAKDTGGRVTITASGTGQAANPTVTLTFKEGTWTNIPAIAAGRGDIVAPTGYWALTTPSATAPVFTFVGTPVAASVYILDFTVMGK